MLQDLNTKVCGHYAVIYSVLRCKGYTLDKVVSTLSEEWTHHRDHIVYRVVNKNFHISPTNVHVQHRIQSPDTLCNAINE